MNKGNYIFLAIGFLAGFGVGYLVTHKSDEEIEIPRQPRPEKESEKIPEEKNSESFLEYAKELSKHQYKDYSVTAEDHKAAKEPYVISPNEFVEDDDYEKVSLIFYSDNVLTNEYNEIIKDVDGIVGLESLKCFGDFEDDSVFVRNDILKTDYEILADQRRYSDIAKH